jgi:hypothetical protein
MRESRPYGFVRGARGNSRPYRYLSSLLMRTSLHCNCRKVAQEAWRTRRFHAATRARSSPMPGSFCKRICASRHRVRQFGRQPGERRKMTGAVIAPSASRARANPWVIAAHPMWPSVHGDIMSRSCREAGRQSRAIICSKQMHTLASQVLVARPRA